MKRSLAHEYRPETPSFEFFVAPFYLREARTRGNVAEIFSTVADIWRLLVANQNLIASDDAVLPYAPKAARNRIARLWKYAQRHPCKPLPRDLPSSDPALRNAESAELLETLTSHLKHGEVDLFHAKFVAGLSDAGIARAVGLPQAAAVRMRLSRLRDRLRGAAELYFVADAPAAGLEGLSRRDATTHSQPTGPLCAAWKASEASAILRRMSEQLLRQLPQVEKVLRWPEVDVLLSRYPRDEVTRALRGALSELRDEILAGRVEDATAAEALTSSALATRIESDIQRRRLSGYRRVINGTGIVLHTGLGRAVLAESAREAFEQNLAGYSLVEVDVTSGERGRREDALQEVLRDLTGAEAAIVVNNNAAATLLLLAALARGKEVIVSRGQLVEIGGSFRIPDILRESGARLVEVGTTNRTYISDYRRAIGPDTGLLLKVHTSNYAIRGFACHTPLGELVALGRERRIPVVSDLGSGCFVDVAAFGFEAEPLVRQSVADGADLVSFSGDKLLGGPQAGVIVGTQEAVGRVRAHPLYRALRVDKVTLTLLEATLRLYLDPEHVTERVPVLRQLSLPAEELRRRTEAFRRDFTAQGPSALVLEVVPSAAQAGSGSLPDQEIPSWALAIRHARRSALDLAAALRSAEPPVFSRVHEDRVLLDFRTVFPHDEPELARLLAQIPP